MTILRAGFKYSRELSRLLSSPSELQKPVVALESTIVSHGMPYPQNLATAQSVERIIRAGGCLPATIALRDGEVNIGLDADLLVDLAKAGPEGRAVKCTTRELGFFLASTGRTRGGAPPPGQQQQQHSSSSSFSSSSSSSLWASTTVASTMHLAALSRIPVFVTGGTGGVHRDHPQTLDVSADLTELARTNVAVISAGVKSILDIPRTLEFLETHGVTVGVLGSDEFPSFFSPKSGCAAPLVFDDVEAAADAILANRELELPGGFLLAVPNPEPLEGVDAAVAIAVSELAAKGVVGKHVTPYLLRRVAELTEGRSLKSNISLVENNARVGAELATAVRRKEIERSSSSSSPPNSSFSFGGFKAPPPTSDSPPTVVVMGGAVVDVVARPLANAKLSLRTSNPGTVAESDGGVGRNIAEVLGRLGSRPRLYSAVGSDARGSGLVRRLEGPEIGVRTDGSVVEVGAHATATYLALLDGDRDMLAAVADMAVLESIPVPPVSALSSASFFVLDGNAPVASAAKALENAERCAGCRVLFEPTSEPKGARFAAAGLLKHVDYCTPNRGELLAMASAVGLSTAVKDGEEGVRETASYLRGKMKVGAALIVGMGKDGVMVVDGSGSRKIKAAEGVQVLNATGAGDTQTGGLVHAMLQGYGLDKSVQFGMACAVESLQCEEKAISPTLHKLIGSLR